MCSFEMLLIVHIMAEHCTLLPELFKIANGGNKWEMEGML